MDWGTHKFLVSLGPEITIKSKNTKDYFLDVLWIHLGSRLSKAGFTYQVHPFAGRYLVEVPEKAFHILTTQFGISKVARFVPIKDLTDFSWLNFIVPKKTFTYVVYVDRVEAPWSKSELLNYKREVLAQLESLAQRNLDFWDNHPCQHFEIRLEARKEGIIAIYDKTDAPSGYPVGVGGHVLHLFSGGPDSVLAALFMARRGQKVTLLFLDDGVEGRFNLVEEAACKVAYFMPDMCVELIAVNYGPTLERLKESAAKRALCLLCKSCMYFVASKLADEIGAHAISTGEILGEQASQTVYSLNFIHRFSEKLLLRPLIGMCKEEVFEYLSKFRISESFAMPRCPYSPKRPLTGPKTGFLKKFHPGKFFSGIEYKNYKIFANCFGEDKNGS
ncbi:thiamine biosynthesis protein ThiI [Thermosulfidibacter takaii ABI70S6]|uniref:Thiamine biosynthesis protein ThiI n=1 Tax=Thermosulfidibacter takaii (strain DSM 17441 / JCM 13301 / NBRC 103674 / ABI70S6) TaxID=1298851 RepID=A0A0S3QUH7_THET7|nr:hypothetical protein [Thermosulfidibacter takaii]BAT71979.1 thiamine biosynthesis protein ThiI [Thermosulfidibacter takaii ABI70S6]